MAKEKIGTLTDPVRVMRRAIKFASRDANRVITSVHLDECGDVVSTDSYRMYVEHGAYVGKSVTIDIGTAHDISKLKLKNNESCELFRDGDKIVVKMGDKTEVIGAESDGTYPRYEQLLDSITVNTTAYVNKTIKPIIAEHKRMKQNVRFDVIDRNLKIYGIGEAEPTVELAKSCDGIDNCIGFDPTYISSALAVFKYAAKLHIDGSLKAAFVTASDNENIKILVMPVRIEGAKPQPRKKKPEFGNIDKRDVIRAIERTAIDRAACETDNNVSGNRASVTDRKILHELTNNERLVKDVQHGHDIWFLDGEFICWTERRYSKRKIHLHYPEIMPVTHRGRAEWIANPEEPKQEQPTEKQEEKPEPTETHITEVVEKLSISNVKEWATEKGLRVEQANDRACVWVCGNSKEWKDEFEAAGFRWGKSKKYGKGWWKKPAGVA